MNTPNNNYNSGELVRKQYNQNAERYVNRYHSSRKQYFKQDRSRCRYRDGTVRPAIP
ncbi:MAG: hypothetical protein ABEJ65_00695 [bacterium]